MQDDIFKVIIENIAKEVGEINSKIDNIICKTDELNEKTIRHDEQIKMIKERNSNKDQEMISLITKNNEEHSSINNKFNKLNIKLAWYAGAIAVIVFIIQFVVQYIMKKI